MNVCSINVIVCYVTYSVSCVASLTFTNPLLCQLEIVTQEPAPGAPPSGGAFKFHIVCVGGGGGAICDRMQLLMLTKVCNLFYVRCFIGFTLALFFHLALSCSARREEDGKWGHSNSFWGGALFFSF